MCHQNIEISFNDLLPSATKGNITIEKDFTVLGQNVSILVLKYLVMFIQFNVRNMYKQ